MKTEDQLKPNMFNIENIKNNHNITLEINFELKTECTWFDVQDGECWLTAAIPPVSFKSEYLPVAKLFA